MMRLERVSAGYDGRDCLFDVSVSFQCGELVGLIGPNGSGKSTLIKAAACQLPISGGCLYLDDKRIERPDPKEIARRVAYMPQLRGAPGITVRQLVAHGRYPHLGFGRALGKTDWEKVDQAMETTGVAQFDRRPVNTLSGGERQRAYLAMLLSQDARLLLLDEPTAFLDVGHQFELMDLLALLRTAGKAVVVAMHELPLALACCDRLLLLSGGHLMIADSPRGIHESGEIERAFHVGIIRSPGGFYALERAPKEARE